MKKLIACLSALLITALVMPQAAGASSSSAGGLDFRAVWVSTVLNLDYPSKPGISNAELMSEADRILDEAAALGLNAIVLQVRPSGDAIYASDIFPWSEYLTGAEGQAPANGFDPLEYWVKEAHKRGLELHAWINPYRVTHSTKNITDASKLSSSNPARLNPEWTKVYGTALYLDPGQPWCRMLIVDGVVELITKYDIDGIHMDDYFYPGPNFDDGDTYALYRNGMERDDWRRENVNSLIKDIQKAVKALRPEVRFGVSPFAIWQNITSDELGSDTSGFESYSSIFSDSRRWVKEGWLDYICPQIYWYIGYPSADYAGLLDWWLHVCKDTGVDLYIGTAAYREEAKEANWSGEMTRQLVLSGNQPGVSGHLFFRFGSLTGSVASQIKEFYRGRGYLTSSTNTAPPITVAEAAKPVVIMDKLSVVQPSANVTLTGAKGYYVFGACVPDKELTLNGAPVTNRTEEGFFSVYVPLNTGSNTLTFAQAGQTTVTRTITVKEPSPPGTPKDPIKINEIAAGEPYYATVTADSAWVYPGNTTTGGSGWLLTKGQRDKVTAVTEDNQWVRLSSGGWVEVVNVSLKTEALITANVLTQGVIYRDGDEIVISWNASAYPAVYAAYQGGKLTVSFGMHTVVPLFADMEGGGLTAALFENVETSYDGVPRYELTFKEGIRLEGYYTAFGDGEFSLHIRTRKALAAGNKPLTGISLVLDAGHGDTDGGAKGAMGAVWSEKDVNLTITLMVAERLRGMGADVTLVRDKDVFFTLLERTEISRSVMPDMFLSIHSNSLDETTDATNVRGLTVWFRNDSSKPLAEALINALHTANPNTTRAKTVNQSNLYVCRPAWTPSVIIECSFMNNIHDFAWLINPANQAAMADSIAAAVVEYYK